MIIEIESQGSFVTFVYTSDGWERYRSFRTRIIPLLDPPFDKGCIGLARIWGTDVRPRSIVTWASAFNLLRYLGNDKSALYQVTNNTDIIDACLHHNTCQFQRGPRK